MNKDEREQSIHRRIGDHIALAHQVEAMLCPDLQRAAEWFADALKKGNKLLFAGNGGSAADAQHLAAEFVGRFEKERRALPAMALTTDSSILTAVGNDYGYRKIFSRQIEGFARAGDVFVAISTSGNSENLIEALEACGERACKTIGLLGRDGGEIGKRVDLPLIVPSKNTARIQEMHIMIGHIICELVENEMASSCEER